MALALIIGAVSGFGGGVAAINLQKNYYSKQEIQSQEIASVNAVTNINTNTTLDIGTAIAQEVMPSVVGVKTITEYNTFFGTESGQGIGTGVIVDEKGYILTNSHVIMDGKAKSITIQLSDGSEIAGEVLWHEVALDLAIVKIDAPNLTAAKLGDSDDIKVGSYALAIGNPMGMIFERSVTQGIVSGLNRSIAVEQQTMEGLIQTDASINEGNSGGPLINSNGEVVGINTVKVKSGEGLGFAVPINTAKPIVEEFMAQGQFTRAYFGIKGVDVQEYINVNKSMNLGTDIGVFVYNIFDNSPAALAGIKESDIIVAIDNEEISTVSQMSKRLYSHRPGDKIKIQIVRNKEALEKEVILTESPKQ